MASIEEKLTKLVEPIIEKLGYELYDVEYAKEGKNYFLRIFIDLYLIHIYFENIESSTLNFNAHRIDVIKNSIERNLSIAISNFNKYSNVSTDFQLPKLKDTDWDKIMDNISIISFMQGININGKIYSGYSIITNTVNEDIVMDDSIYIEDNNTNIEDNNTNIEDNNTNTFHRITEENLNLNNVTGIYNVNLERRSSEDSASKTVYYFPVYGAVSYTHLEYSEFKISTFKTNGDPEYDNGQIVGLSFIFEK